MSSRSVALARPKITAETVGKKATRSAAPRKSAGQAGSADRQATEMLHELRTRGEALTVRINTLLNRLG